MAARQLVEADVRFGYRVFFGGPGETLDTVRETIDFLEGVTQPVFFRAGVRVFEGTELERRAGEEGLVDDDHDILSPTVYLSRDLGPEFMAWLDQRCELHENWLAITRMTS